MQTPPPGTGCPGRRRRGPRLLVMQQSIHERGLVTHAQQQVRVLFALPYHLESKVLPWGPMCHPPHLLHRSIPAVPIPGVPASRCVALGTWHEILHLAFPCAERGEKSTRELSWGGGGMNSPC